MNDNLLIFSVFLIFFGAAILSTLALYTRQSLLVAYMLLGLILGPFGLKLISEPYMVHDVGEVGIIFLLFLLGLNLHPQDLLQMFKSTFWVTLFSSLIFLVVGFVISYWFRFGVVESLIIGTAIGFSSTIIGLKLLPTTALHHQHIGGVVISILLMQDLFAILILLLIHFISLHSFNVVRFTITLLSLPILLTVTFLFVRFILIKLFSRFSSMKEYIFLLAIAWCLGLSELAKIVGLSYDIGAFIAGVSIAANPISLYISESLKPVRDFFLVMFFFSIGASFNLHYFSLIIAPVLVLVGVLIILKPLTFRFLLHKANETKHVAWEVGFRLGQTSVFSLLVAYLAADSGLISAAASYLVQATTMLTFIVSSYIIVLFYPTPIAISEKLRKD